jgi:hypothetical protein
MCNIETVEVSGRTYHVHPMTAGQLVRWHRYLLDPKADKVTADFMMYAYCVRDDQGKPVWANADDAEGMSVEDRVALRPVVERINGFDEDDDEKKANSAGTPPS